MTATVPVRKPGDRIPELSPFESGQEPVGAFPPGIPVRGPAYGCVEWFHYVERPEDPAEARERACRSRRQLPESS